METSPQQHISTSFPFASQGSSRTSSHSTPSSQPNGSKLGINPFKSTAMKTESHKSTTQPAPTFGNVTANGRPRDSSFHEEPTLCRYGCNCHFFQKSVREQHEKIGRPDSNCHTRRPVPTPIGTPGRESHFKCRKPGCEDKFEKEMDHSQHKRKCTKGVTPGAGNTKLNGMQKPTHIPPLDHLQHKGPKKPYTVEKVNMPVLGLSNVKKPKPRGWDP